MSAMLRLPGVSTAIRVVLFLVGFGILAFLILELDIDEILRLVARTGWNFVVILLLYGGCQAARAGALWLCQPQAEVAPYWNVLAIRISAEAVRLLTFTGPFLAEPSKVWLLGRRGLGTKEGIAAIIAELVTHSLIATTLSIVAFAYLIANFEVSPFVRTTVLALMSAMGTYVVVAVVAIACRIYLIGAGVRLLVGLGLLGFARDRREVRLMEDLILLVLRERPARLGLILTFQVVANLFLMLEVLVALQAMGVAVPPHYPFLIEGGLKFVGVAFFFVPAQVGVSEGAYAILFDTLGLAAAAGVSLAFIRRLRTLVAAGIGLVSIALLSSGQGRKDHLLHRGPP